MRVLLYTFFPPEKGLKQLEFQILKPFSSRGKLVRESSKCFEKKKHSNSVNNKVESILNPQNPDQISREKSKILYINGGTAQKPNFFFPKIIKNTRQMAKTQLRLENPVKIKFNEGNRKNVE